MRTFDKTITLEFARSYKKSEKNSGIPAAGRVYGRHRLARQKNSDAAVQMELIVRRSGKPEIARPTSDGSFDLSPAVESR